jgi:copper resistance protein C
MKSPRQVYLISILLLLTSLFFAQPVLAHAKLATESPLSNAVLLASPNELALTFSEAIELGFSQVTLMDSNKNPITIAKPRLDEHNPNQVRIQLPQPLGADIYEVQWHVLSVDGHKTSGSYSFTVK